MKHEYEITGMTCGGCVAKVKTALLKMPDVLSADVRLEGPQAEIEMQRHISDAEFQSALSAAGNYTIKSNGHAAHAAAGAAEESKSWLETYKPLLLIVAFIAGVTGLSALQAGGGGMLWMQYFMAGFFIVFSFFKLLDLRAFADSYAMYDLLAKHWRGYGFIYPFIELALGIAYLVNFEPIITNIATIIVLGFSSIGVIQSVLDKQKIKCACLGSVFNLPMSTVTIIEDLAMVAMAVLMLLMM